MILLKITGTNLSQAFNPTNAEATFIQSAHKDTKFFENHLNLVMLVLLIR